MTVGNLFYVISYVSLKKVLKMLRDMFDRFSQTCSNLQLYIQNDALTQMFSFFLI